MNHLHVIQLNFYVFKYLMNTQTYFNISPFCTHTIFLFQLKVSKYWNILALDGSNWQKIDLFDFQRDIEVSFIIYFALPSIQTFI